MVSFNCWKECGDTPFIHQMSTNPSILSETSST